MTQLYLSPSLAPLPKGRWSREDRKGGADNVYASASGTVYRIEPAHKGYPCTSWRVFVNGEPVSGSIRTLGVARYWVMENAQ